MAMYGLPGSDLRKMSELTQFRTGSKEMGQGSTFATEYGRESTRGDLENQRPPGYTGRSYWSHDPGFKQFYLHPSAIGANTASENKWGSMPSSIQPATGGLGYGGGDDPSAGYYMQFSPGGRFLGQEPGWAKSKGDIEAMSDAYLGPTTTGGWGLEDEPMKARADRLTKYFEGQGGPTGSGAWKEQNVIGKDTTELAKLLSTEFQPGGAETQAQAQSNLAFIQPFEENLPYQTAMEERNMAMGGLSPDIIQNIIGMSEDYDPMAQGGWENFQNQIDSMYGHVDMGNLLPDWLDEAQQSWTGYTGAESAYDLSRQELGRIGDTTREGLLSNKILSDAQKYGAGIEARGTTPLESAERSNLLTEANIQTTDLRQNLEQMLSELDVSRQETMGFGGELETDLLGYQTGIGDLSGHMPRDWFQEMLGNVGEQYG